MPGTVIMGVIFVDIKGFPLGEYHATGTNLGSIRFVHGGVARNVAEDMARIGVTVMTSTKFAASYDENTVADLSEKIRSDIYTE